ncbi:BPI fold-containing family A member 2 [Sarcophilus harrisii]|uniref:BPI fold containing family A member 2 n=1 Tax=Sarcophilus harrisii TaxID=9305 RepID=G3VS27_SARHA|nr:BPI fold-containing family A member 2 [Sarcophilus harrisii]
MLSLWRLTLLCGLLIGPSCCLLDSLSILPAVVNKDLDILKDKVQVLGHDFFDEMSKLEISLEQLVGTILRDIEKLSGKALNAFISKVVAFLGLKIEDIAYLNIKPELSADGNSLQLRLPVSAAITLKLNPLASDLIKAQANLDVLLQLKIVTDDKTGLPKVTLGECLVDQTTIKITILDSSASLQARIAEKLDAIIKKLIPSVMLKKICPLLGSYANLMDVQKVQNLINHLKTEKPVQAPAI